MDARSTTSSFYSATGSPLSPPPVDFPFAAGDLRHFAPIPSLRHSVEHPPRSPISSSEQSSGDPSSSPGVGGLDVFVGWRGRSRGPAARFVRWLCAELRMQGVSCYPSDRRRCADASALRVAGTAMAAATVGVVVVTPRSLANPFTVEELGAFLEGNKLVPVFFGLPRSSCVADIVRRKGEPWERFGGELWASYGGREEDWMFAVDGLCRSDEALEASAADMRGCISKAVDVLGVMLGRKKMVERVKEWEELAAKEFPFTRNPGFVGRKLELQELESMLFGDAVVNMEEKERPCVGRRIMGSAKKPPKGRGATAGSSYATLSELWKKKGKDPVLSRDEEEIAPRGPYRNLRNCRKKTDDDSMESPPYHGRGFACVSGDSGIGKTELVLEFAYRFAQRYKMVLWVGGEARSLRWNYLRLLPLFGVEVENEAWSERGGNKPKSFVEVQEEVILRVRKELMRDIPYLLIIDNLEMEKDWWDGRSFMDLLPRLGGETHVIISTRSPHIAIKNDETLKLMYLSGSEAFSLMTTMGGWRDLPSEEVDALRTVEEKLGRLPLGLALVGALLSELKISPTKLLEEILKMPRREPMLNTHDSFLVQLLDLCFAILDRNGLPKNLAAKMIEASSWLAPMPISACVLEQAALKASGRNRGRPIALWSKKCRKIFTCARARPEEEVGSNAGGAASLMLRLCLVRGCVGNRLISFHHIVKVYARKRSDLATAGGAIRAACAGGFAPECMDHLWAACFLVFKLGKDPPIVTLPFPDLVFFVEHICLPLAAYTSRCLFHCNAALELLRVSNEALDELIDDSFLNGLKISSDGSCSHSSMRISPTLHRPVACLRATLLETRAKLMMRGGLYDIAEQLCRTALSSKEVLFGLQHSETKATSQILDRIMFLQSKYPF